MTTGTGSSTRTRRDDLDGDGNICTMRKKDPFGAYKTDPEDPRLMVRVKPGEKGEWTMLGEEGLDNDGDGQVNEDGEGYVDPNRNWGFDWAPPYVQGGSGEYPFSGGRAQGPGRMDHDQDQHRHRLVLHNNGGMLLRGPSRKGLGEYPPQDVAVYDYLGKQGERIIPGYRYMISWKDLYTTYGDSGEWITQTAGAYFYCAEVFQGESEAFKGVSERNEPGTPREEAVRDIFSEGVSERERIKFSDNVVSGELYKPWKPFKHPEYGDVEIGGWVKMSSRLGAPFMIKDLVHRNAMAVLFTAKHLPEVSLEVLEVKPLGGDLYPGPDALVQSQGHPVHELSRPEGQSLSQGHAHGDGRRRQGRRGRASDRPLPRPGRLQEGSGPRSSSWSFPASARSSTSSWWKGRARSRSAMPPVTAAS